MKKMNKIALLLAGLAAGNSAQAQEGRLVAADKSYIFSSTTDADGTGNISYQWFRNGEAIPNATGEIYVLPAELANGANVEFKRGARSTTCAGNISYSNIFFVTFCKGLVVGSLCWATTNVDDYQTFAIRPDMYTKFYQWNNATAWDATAQTLVGWSYSPITSAVLTNNPCPAGWRLPTREEYQALLSGSVPVGGTWVGANVRGNAVAGRFYGVNSATCTLPNNMDGCVFLSAVGSRYDNYGTLYQQGNIGRYWSGTSVSSNYAYCMNFDSSTSTLLSNVEKENGRTVRCVR